MTSNNQNKDDPTFNIQEVLSSKDGSLSIKLNSPAMKTTFSSQKKTPVQQQPLTNSSYYYQPAALSFQRNLSQTSMSSSGSGKKSKENSFVTSTANDWFSDEDEIAKLSISQSKNSSTITNNNNNSSNNQNNVVTSATPSSSASTSSKSNSNTTSTAAGSAVVVAHNTTSTEKKPSISGRVLPKEVKVVSDVEPSSKPNLFQKKTTSPVSLSHSDSQNQFTNVTGQLAKSDSEWVHLPEPSADEKLASELLKLNNTIARMDKFKQTLESHVVDLDKLRKLSWNGIPAEYRAISWQLLMGYLPANSERRVSALQKKRQEYNEYVKQSFGGFVTVTSSQETKLDHLIWHQIHIDVPRTNPTIKLYQHPKIQQSLERILYCWAIRHPASGYVQGINDLSTPFFQVFLCYELRLDEIHDGFDIENGISDDILRQSEADTFWCLTKLLDGIQDNYTHGQPGILRQIQKMKELIKRIDVELYDHIQAQGIDFIQFSFRWMNCLLMRELSLNNVIRMWDTYLAEGIEGFSEFHVYVCAAFLAKWSGNLRKMGLEEILIFLQGMRGDWKESNVEVLLSEAYMYKQLFHNSPMHLQDQKSDKQVQGQANGGWTI